MTGKENGVMLKEKEVVNKMRDEWYVPGKVEHTIVTILVAIDNPFPLKIEQILV